LFAARDFGVLSRQVLRDGLGDVAEAVESLGGEHVGEAVPHGFEVRGARRQLSAQPGANRLSVSRIFIIREALLAARHLCVNVRSPLSWRQEIQSIIFANAGRSWMTVTNSRRKCCAVPEICAGRDGKDSGYGR
jgi:hypothetical protein